MPLTKIVFLACPDGEDSQNGLIAFRSGEGDMAAYEVIISFSREQMIYAIQERDVSAGEMAYYSQTIDAGRFVPGNSPMALLIDGNEAATIAEALECLQRYMARTGNYAVRMGDLAQPVGFKSLRLPRPTISTGGVIALWDGRGEQVYIVYSREHVESILDANAHWVTGDMRQEVEARVLDSGLPLTTMRPLLVISNLAAGLIGYALEVQNKFG